MRKPDPPLSSSQPDPRVLAFLGHLQTIFLCFTFVVAGVVFLGWLVPGVDRILPHGWELMKVNSSVLALASSASLVLWQPRRSPRSLAIARLLGILVFLLAAATLFEHFGYLPFPLETLLAPDAHSALPGRLSLQTAWSFLLIGAILTNIRARKGLAGPLLDVLTLVIFLVVLTFFSGYLFGALRLYGLSLATRMAPQTLFCVALLSFLLINRRTEYGFLGILIGGGIGGKTARSAAPWAICLPFVLTGVRGFLERGTTIPPEYTRALSASILALFGFCLIILLARRSNDLENATRELSLRDELTGLYNRRGFYFLAEQAHRLAKRSGTPFFVLFVDLDNLKLINDALGHDVGSERLQQIASLLEQTFRESDIVGRLGGDEFVVAGRSEAGVPKAAVERLQRRADSLAADQPAPYALSFSIGCVVADNSNTETLDELVDRADALMYEAKRASKQPRGLSILTPA
jgi:diguanylate cyclase (GGDEF)-like protein